MNRAEEWRKRLENMPECEPIGCVNPNCYLSVDPRDGFCEVHGLPEEDERGQ